MARYFYSSDIASFLIDNETRILGALTENYPLQNLAILQTNAWREQIRILKLSLREFSDGHIFFEFAIPRMGKRADCVFIINGLVFIVEFKVGEDHYSSYAIEQVVDYSLDLKNFHEGSHHQKLIPLLVATNAPSRRNKLTVSTDNLFDIIFANSANLSDVIRFAVFEIEAPPIDAEIWADSRYKPTPTIVEAAQALYNNHSVEDISRSDSGAINLTQTSDCINRIITSTDAENTKSICFVTGVPGAGKTLAGLNIATQNMKFGDDHSVFLSGNGPLVDVLREALARNIVATSKYAGVKVTKATASRSANAFIQNIHHFRDEYVGKEEAPSDRIVVFDEAQRAWTNEQLSGFMRRKKGRLDFNQSEPQFLIDVMNRHESCTVICLIGGGQEINRGEAGLEEWLEALRTYFPDWVIHYSNLIVEDTNYLNNDELKHWLTTNGRQETDLHLAVSVRSFRSENASAFVQSVLSSNVQEARTLYETLRNDNYPVVLTRNLDTAKQWLRKSARGSERTGLVASAGAYRLRPLGLSVKHNIDAPIWFLNDKDDVRSSYFLEEVATEFDIQGLELDWTCVCWDGDLYFQNGKWNRRKFKGTKWQNINDEFVKRYLTNAYRVLLTRARQGMVIFVPHGDTKDETRLPEFYDGTFEYLRSIGIRQI
ncbi:MAG TPA: DUF2075 domain-containing protein [Pyrinomonadaceae bacterium]|nr:DUF2075 domain-containing protein [Pyrinomonadaceae bacterium]